MREHESAVVLEGEGERATARAREIFTCMIDESTQVGSIEYTSMQQQILNPISNACILDEVCNGVGRRACFHEMPNS